MHPPPAHVSKLLMHHTIAASHCFGIGESGCLMPPPMMVFVMLLDMFFSESKQSHNVPFGLGTIDYICRLL